MSEYKEKIKYRNPKKENDSNLIEKTICKFCNFVNSLSLPGFIILIIILTLIFKIIFAINSDTKMVEQLNYDLIATFEKDSSCLKEGKNNIEFLLSNQKNIIKTIVNDNCVVDLISGKEIKFYNNVNKVLDFKVFLNNKKINVENIINKK